MASYELDLERFVTLALECVHRPYPNQMALRMESDEDLRLPQVRTPAFYGCYDWHSAVHGHWLLAVARERSRQQSRIDAVLEESLTQEKLEIEAEYLRHHPAFERPYGLAWLLCLDGALNPRFRARLAPVRDAAKENLGSWLGKLSHPTRSGTHAQTAFSLGLCLDWAEVFDLEFAEILRAHARRFFADDREYALHLEPSGEDFLSPSLGAVDLMRRVLKRDEFAAFCERTLHGVEDLAPVEPMDRSDGRLAHLDGLNLSRAFMLHAIAEALEDEERARVFRRLSRLHAKAGLGAVNGEHYAGSHWLGTFAMKLLLAA